MLSEACKNLSTGINFKCSLDMKMMMTTKTSICQKYCMLTLENLIIA